MAKLKIGLALGSGAARGWAHIGVINVLEEAGIHADVVAGCSIGALVGAAFVTGSMGKLHDWLMTLDWRGIVSLMDFSFSRGGLIMGREVTEFLASLGVRGTIEDLPLPFMAVATDMATGREIWLKQGDLGQAIHASFSMPGLFAPVKRGNQWLLDGGLVNPVPVSACRALGADVIIAVNLNGDLVGRRRMPRLRRDDKDLTGKLLERLPESMADGLGRIAPSLLARRNAPGYFDVLGASINIMQDQITRSRLAGEPPHVLINPRLSHFNVMDFDRAKEAIAEGEKRARAALPHIRDIISRYGELA